MTGSQEPRLIAVHALPGQARPLRVWAMREPDALACEALTEADRLLSAGGARLAVEPAHNELTHSGILLAQK